MKIAVIGSGISGLSAAYYLSNTKHTNGEKFEVHLFESSPRIGGHTHTVEVSKLEQKFLVDTGFIVCNNRNYPHFLKLMDEIGIDLQDSEMSFSVKTQDGSLEYNGTSINSLFCQRKNFLRPSFYRMIKDILRFNSEATSYYEQMQNHPDKIRPAITLEQYLKENNYSKNFIEYYIMPMGAAIWSASRREMRDFPLDFFVRFFHHHGMLTVNDRPQWMVLKGGSKSYIPKLLQPLEGRVHKGASVLKVGSEVGAKGERNKNWIEYKNAATNEVNKEFFDQVILACHGDEALKMLDHPTENEKEILGGFSYRFNETILHQDEKVMPQSLLGHASWNYFIPTKEQESIAVTYYMNRLQSISGPEKFFVSLNMRPYIDPAKILKVIEYWHPVYNHQAVKSQTKWGQINGTRGIHYCGAYWGNGFHEDGVASALKVVDSIKSLYRV
ncbi:MAG: FAD-dependent oxidoreductase [Bacteriovoracaceae bacterium]|nr:FAD-dependent oxidoreductase [Bacteriovoracaceae bacterium]